MCVVFMSPLKNTFIYIFTFKLVYYDIIFTFKYVFLISKYKNLLGGGLPREGDTQLGTDLYRKMEKYRSRRKYGHRTNMRWSDIKWSTDACTIYISTDFTQNFHLFPPLCSSLCSLRFETEDTVHRIRIVSTPFTPVHKMSTYGTSLPTGPTSELLANALPHHTLPPPSLSHSRTQPHQVTQG